MVWEGKGCYRKFAEVRGDVPVGATGRSPLQTRKHGLPVSP